MMDPADNDARCPVHPDAATGYTDPTGGDPFMGGPVSIRVCLVCGRECVSRVVRQPVSPHHRCGIGTKREHPPHTFRALIMGGVVRRRCPGYVKGEQ